MGHPHVAKRNGSHAFSLIDRMLGETLCRGRSPLCSYSCFLAHPCVSNNKGITMFKSVCKISAFFTVISLIGCLVPEKFSASVNVKPDGSYTYKYDGTATHALAVATLKKQGSLSANDEAGLKQEEQKAAKAPGVRKFKYLGAGRYEVTIEQDLTPGQPAALMQVISVTKDKDNVFTVAPAEMKQKDKNTLKDLGIKVDGKAEVYLPSNAKVISQNASGTPSLFSKAYTWNIGAMDQQPSIKFRLPI